MVVETLSSTALRAVLLPDNATARAAWDGFVFASPGGHLLQTWGWGEVKRKHGWPAERIAVIEGSQLNGDVIAALASGTARIVAGAQILYRQKAGVALAYVPRGPLVDWHNQRITSVLLNAISRAARRHRAIYLKIEPNHAFNSETDAVLHTLRFQPSPESVQPVGSILVPVDQPTQEDILTAMKPKTRYNVRLAHKRGVTTRLARTDADFALFYGLMQRTGSRDAFGVHSAAYYRDVWRIFNGPNAPEPAPDAPFGSARESVPCGGQVGLWLAEFEGAVVAAIMVSVLSDEVIYLYGASDDSHRKVMPTYLIQWRAMQWARALGARKYDLWGIPASVVTTGDEREELEQKNVRDGMWGVYRFKQGFGGESVRYQGPYDKPYVGPLYTAWMWWQRRQDERANAQSVATELGEAEPKAVATDNRDMSTPNHT